MSANNHPLPLVIACALLSSSCGQSIEHKTGSSPREPLPDAVYVGRDACKSCHAAETEAWTGSHHDLAMQHANADTVLGDFDDATFQKNGVASLFFKRDGEHWTKTDNANGELEEFRIAYTFGVAPLQQYLIEFEDGRLQALPIAWNIPDKRWFHLYPDEAIPHTDLLHWTGREQNWNYMCAECHSTNLQKNYTLKSDTFNTSWSEMDVSCEACHGPASNHVTLANESNNEYGSGLLVNLDDRDGATWQMNGTTGIAERMPPRMSPSAQPEACGRCHSRRGLATAEYEFGKPLADTHTVALLDEHLYFADGQIDDEVYVYGSFLQSKMYRAGVTCTDCHDPHSANLRTGRALDALCGTCHLPAKFAATTHHRHEPEAVECVDCHMTTRDYMVIDGRRDHSFRIPRPDLTLATGSPNACNECHDDESAEWALARVTDWYGAPDEGHFGFAIQAGRSGAAGSNEALVAVVNDNSVAGIVRATALTLLRRPFTEEQTRVIRRMLSNADPLVRIGALRALTVLPVEIHAAWAAPLLADPVRSVRLAAVDVVSPVRQSLDATFLPGFQRAEREFMGAQFAIAERPEALGNLANLFRERGDIERSFAFFRSALAREPRLSSARANLADLYRALGQDTDAERVLREGLELDQNDAYLRHSLGLLLVRTGRPDDALQQLQLAAELLPESRRFAYVYAVALNSLGQPEAAADVLRVALQRFPDDPEIRAMLQSLAAPER